MATSASYIYITVYAIAIPLQINFNTNARLLKRFFGQLNTKL